MGVCQHVSMHHICAQCPCRPEEGIGPSGLELQTVVSCCMDAGTKPGSPRRAAGASPPPPFVVCFLEAGFLGVVFAPVLDLTL